MANSQPDVWSDRNLDVLRDLANLLLEQDGSLSPEIICRLISETDLPPGSCPRPRALRNFLSGKTRHPQKHKALTSLLIWCLGYGQLHLQTVANHSAFMAARELAIARRLDVNGSNLPSNARMGTNRSTNHAPPSVQALSDAVSLIGSLIHVEWQDFTRLQERLFAPQDFRANKGRFERHFLCYRYHSQPGKIVKSFLVLMGPSEEVPEICRFASFFGGITRKQRRANGIVLPLRNATYLVGEVDQGAGLKIFALRDLTTGRDEYEGLVLALDDDLTPVTSRTVLVPTPLVDSRQAGVGIWSEAKLDKEIHSFKRQMRNRVDFRLVEQVTFDRQAIGQQAVVVKVAELCRDSKTGRSRFATNQGREFNPAASAHYTFNSALRMWGAGEE